MSKGNKKAITKRAVANKVAPRLKTVQDICLLVLGLAICAVGALKLLPAVIEAKASNTALVFAIVFIVVGVIFTLTMLLHLIHTVHIRSSLLKGNYKVVEDTIIEVGLLHTANPEASLGFWIKCKDRNEKHPKERFEVASEELGTMYIGDKVYLIVNNRDRVICVFNAVKYSYIPDVEVDDLDDKQ